VNGTVHDVAGGEWVDFSGTSHSLDSWEKIVNSQFDVTITSTNGPVAPGNTLDVTADVTNNGTDSDTQTVALDIDNSVGQVDSQSVTLSGGGSTTTTLSWSVPSGQTEQDYTATVSSADDTASRTVTVSSVTVPSSVIHRWKLDDVGTATATDSIGSADGTVNGVSNVSGTYIGGSAGDFDGTDDKIDTPATAPLGSMTILATIDFNTDMSSGEQINGFNSSNFGTGTRILRIADGATNQINAIFRNDSGNFESVGHTVSQGRYRLAAVLDESNELRLAVEGSVVATTPAGSYQTPQSAHSLGYDRKNGRHFDGILDECMIANEAYTATQLTDDYNRQPWS